MQDLLPFCNSTLPFPKQKESQIRFEVNSLDSHSRLERVTRPLTRDRSFFELLLD